MVFSGSSGRTRPVIARDPQIRYRTSRALMDDLERVAARVEGKPSHPVHPGSDSAFAAKEGDSNVTAWRNVALISLLTAALLLVAVIIMVFKPGTTPGDVRSGGHIRPGGMLGQTDDRSQTGSQDTQVLDQAAFDVRREMARNQIKAGRYDLAINGMRELLAAHKNSALAPDIRREIGSAMFEQAQSMANAGQLDAALDLCRSIASEHADSEYASLSNELQATIR